MLRAELDAERSKYLKEEAVRQKFEKSNRELQEVVVELKAEIKTRSKAAVSALENKIKELEEQLEQEARERQKMNRAFRREAKRGKEMQAKAEEERRHADQQCKDQVNLIRLSLFLTTRHINLVTKKA